MKNQLDTVTNKSNSEKTVVVVGTKETTLSRWNEAFGREFEGRKMVYIKASQDLKPCSEAGVIVFIFDDSDQYNATLRVIADFRSENPGVPIILINPPNRDRHFMFNFIGSIKALPVNEDIDYPEFLAHFLNALPTFGPQ